MRTIYTLSLFLLFFQGFAQNHEAEIKKMFDNFALQGININEKLPYRYYFKDGDSTKLVRLCFELYSKDFYYVSIERNDVMKYVLTIEKEQKHTAETMIQQEKDFVLLAKRFGVQAFDGFEVSTTEDDDSHFERFKTKVSTSDPDKLFTWGKELLNNLLFAEATIVYERCIRLKIKTDSSYYYCGYAHKELENFEDVVTNWEEAVKINPNFLDAAFGLGHIYRKTGKQGKAVDAYQKALIIRPENDKVLYALAYILAENGDKIKAIEHCKKAIAINPKNSYAQELLKNIE